MPVEHIEDGHIVLNISWSAAHNLQMENELVSFEARFSGVAYAVSVPMHAIKGIYARESGQGMMFQDDPGAAADNGQDAAPDSDSASDADKAKRPDGRPDLRIIK